MLYAISKSELYTGFIKIGIAPERIKPEITEEWTLRGRIIFLPFYK